MAMHKKLQPGALLFTFQDPIYNQWDHQGGREKYRIEFKALHVFNRRERSSGEYVPANLIPTLDKLGIRYIESQHRKDRVLAVGCRAYSYYSCNSDLPYPSPEQVKAAQQAYEQTTSGSRSNQGVELQQVEFVEEFKEKKMSNMDSLYSLSNSLNDYVAQQTYIN